MLLLFERRGSQLLCQTDAVANHSLLRSEVIYVHIDSRFAQVRCTKGWSRVQGKGTTQQFPLGALILSIFCLITCPSFYQPYKKLTFCPFNQLFVCVLRFLTSNSKSQRGRELQAEKLTWSSKAWTLQKSDITALPTATTPVFQQPVTAFNRTTINLQNYAQVGTSIT